MLRRRSLRALPRPYPALASSGRESAVAAAVVDEWYCFPGVRCEDLTDEYGVITARQRLTQRAIDPCHRIAEHGRAAGLGPIRDACEFIARLVVCEPSCHALRALRQYVDGERAGLVNAIVRVCRSLDTNEDERRIERERGHGGRGEATGRAIGSRRRDDGHTGYPMAQHSPELGGVDRHGTGVAVGCFRVSGDFTFARRSPPVPSRPGDLPITRAPVAGCLIVALLTACDNVSWGGADLTVVPPPPRPSGAPAPGVDPGPEQLPTGPILYRVNAGAAGASIVPVAEIQGDSLVAIRPSADPRNFAESFIAEHMRQGAEFALFRGGIRAGTFIAQSASVESTACGLRPRAQGLLELGETSRAVTEFLALEKVQAPQIERRIEESLEPTRTMRVLAPIFADRILRTRGASLPGNWDRSFAQLQPFAVPNAQDAGFTATFLVGDTLGPGLDDEGHAVFFVAVPARLSYDTVFVELRRYESGGKAAPRLIDALDWDRDDSLELLLEVYGTNDSWIEAIGRNEDGTWRRIFLDRCIAPEPPADTVSDSLATDTVPPDTTS